ncbi:MAG TPA: hypothetical protein VFW45_13970 [Candidatus Polarisedimenticolia bacterium]|nr:hypothetical protein [Candidatus Polarisedimenticolia bacterium]
MRSRRLQWRARCLITLLLACLSPPASPSPEEPKQAPFIQREEVRFVTLDLLVEDKRSGHWRRTTDLRQEQLKVLMGGKEIQLDSFEGHCRPSTGFGEATARPPDAQEAEGTAQEAQKAPPEGADTEVHRYILYFDLENLTLAGRNNSFRAASEWAEKSVQPQDEVMIITGGLSLRIVRPLLPASQHLKEDIQAASADFSAVDTWADGERNRMDEVKAAVKADRAEGRMSHQAEILADGYAALDYDVARRGLEYAHTVMAMYESVPGIKNLIFFSETLRQVPGSMYLPPPTVISKGGVQPDRRALSDVVAPMQQLAREASDKNVRIYAVQAGALEKAVEDPMTFLSTETGGAHIEGTNRLAGVFDRAREDLECFYRIGFRLPARQSGQTERIWVRIPEDESKYRLRYRRTLDDPSREQRDETSIRAAFLRPSAAKGFPVGMEVKLLNHEEHGARFRVQILMPLEGLTALPGSDPAHREVRVEVGGIVVPLSKTADVSGLMEDADVWSDVAVSRKSLKFSRQATLQIPSAPPGTPRGRKAGLYTREFLAPPGRYRLVFVANDLNGHTVTAAVAEFESGAPVSPLAGAMLGFEGHDLIPLPAEDPSAKKETAWSGKELEDASPEIDAGLLLAARPGIGTERSLWAVYEVCRRDAQATAASKRVARTSTSSSWRLDRMLDCMGKSLELPALPLTPPAGEAPCIVLHEKVPSSELPQGTCRLSVILSQDGKVEPTRELEFTVLPARPEPAPTTSP